MKKRIIKIIVLALTSFSLSACSFSLSSSHKSSNTTYQNTVSCTHVFDGPYQQTISPYGYSGHARTCSICGAIDRANILQHNSSGYSTSIDDDGVMTKTTYCTLCNAIVKQEQVQRYFYTITWKNYDGEVIHVDDKVMDGTTPYYDGPTPTKPGTNEGSYEFNGRWSPEITEVNSDQEYTAQFEFVPNTYEVTFKNEDGTILYQTQCQHGDTPVYEGETPKTISYDEEGLYAMVFDGWDKEPSPITQDTTYTATFKKTFAFICEADPSNLGYYKCTGVVDCGGMEYVTLPTIYNGYPISSYSEYLLRDLPYVSHLSMHALVTKGHLTDSLVLYSLFNYTTKNSYAISYNSIFDRAIYPKSLKSVHIGKIEKSISENCFVDCPASSIVIDDCSTIKSIGARAFNSCTNLESFDIPSSVTSIGSSAFAGCSSLESIILPQGITSIAASSFQGCRSIVSVRIPTNVTSIGGQAFMGCTSLEEVFINSAQGELTIEKEAFNECTSLKRINIPFITKYINSSAFKDTSLEEIALPFIGTQKNANHPYNRLIALFGTSLPDSLKKVSLVNPCTSINLYAFEKCDTIETLYLDYSITTIESGGLDGLSSLKNFEVNEGNGTFSALDGVLCNKEQTTIVRVPQAKEGLYIIPDSVTELGAESFNDCKSLEGVILSTNVMKLGSYCFDGANPNIKVYYLGTYQELLTILNNNSLNSIGGLTIDNLWFYSETAPTEEGHYWRYVNDIPTIW